ncbi:TetR/AcrR family transcriptional regulator C-terminal domain-containing protein [Streptomyces tubbatahanensis]|uniref:TetR/AcrR family transcriptional regulator C-terminal domain-containing protein n=1 Tax=Streptomyces tubbatahanensis TaxID=2923272 RepID=A0ABY3XTQ5_9ACTN|nr:TetR/AcrR family transcriptional regulator C-terminal domain-containing protein [Streptomyces tubbatahanensis]UNS97800.1 TetR/AcrR family transcriptional regulator C-terminal domain-containing protein [Streptomyces tubbatahanensis]
MSDGSRTSRMRRTSVWLEDRPEARRKASGASQTEGLDREKITAAAVRLLDTEGLARFSMRRLAADLGVTAMSVYWYVDRKDDLLELALDAVEGELEVPDAEAEGADWREQLRQAAFALRGLLRRHPWASGTLGSFLNVGPSAMGFQLGVRRVLLRSGLPEQQADGALAALFSFVYGHAAVEESWNRRCSEAGVSSQDCFDALRTALGARPEYTAGAEAVYPVAERDFGVALECVIAGIEAGTRGGRGPAPQGRATPVIPPQPPSPEDR